MNIEHLERHFEATPWLRVSILQRFISLTGLPPNTEWDARAMEWAAKRVQRITSTAFNIHDLEREVTYDETSHGEFPPGSGCTIKSFIGICFHVFGHKKHADGNALSTERFSVMQSVPYDPFPTVRTFGENETFQHFLTTHVPDGIVSLTESGTVGKGCSNLFLEFFILPESLIL